MTYDHERIEIGYETLNLLEPFNFASIRLLALLKSFSLQLFFNSSRRWRYSDWRLSRQQVPCGRVCQRRKFTGRVRVSSCQGGSLFYYLLFIISNLFVRQVSRCCGLKITSEGYVVTLAKNNHHVLVLNTLYIA